MATFESTKEPPSYSNEVSFQLVDNSPLVSPLATVGFKKISVSGSSLKMAVVQ